MTDAILEIRIDPSGAVTGGRVAARTMDQIKKWAKGTTTAVNRLRAGFKGLGSSAFGLRGILVSLGGAAAIGGLIKKIGAFEQSMSNVQAVTGVTGVAFQQLSAQAKNLGATTVFSASQAASGMEFLGRAGFETNEVMAALPATLDLAKAGALDLGVAADIASNILSGFALPAGEMGRAADVIAETAANANTNVQQLGDGMKFVAPVAAALGISIEESAAAMGVLSNAGLQGSLAGTGLRRVLSELASPAKKSRDILAQLGLTISQVNPETNDLNTIIGHLADSGITAGQALEFFGDRGGPALLALTSQRQDLTDLTKKTNNAAGAAKRMGDIMSDNLFGATKQVQSAFEALILRIGDSGFLENLTNKFQDLAETLRSNEFKDFADDVGQKLSKAVDLGTDALSFLSENFDLLVLAVKSYIVLKVGTVFGLAAQAGWGLVKSLKAATASQTLLNIAVKANPYIIAATALTGLAAVIFTLNGRNLEAEKRQKAHTESMRAAIRIVDELKDATGERRSELLKMNEAKIKAAESELALAAARLASFKALNLGLRGFKGTAGNLRDQKEMTDQLAEATRRLNEAKSVTSTDLNDTNAGQAFPVRPNKKPELPGAGQIGKESDAIKDLRDEIVTLQGELNPAAALMNDFNEAVEKIRAADAAGIFADDTEAADDLIVALNDKLIPAFDKLNAERDGTARTAFTLDEMRQGVLALQEVMDPAIALTTQFATEQNLLKAALDAGILSQDQYALILRNLTVDYTTAADAAKVYRDATGKVVATGADLNSIIEETKTEFDKLAERREKILLLLSETTEHSELLTQALNDTNAAMNRVATDGATRASQALKDYAKEAMDVGKASEQVALSGMRHLEDAFMGIIDGSKSASEAFADFATSIIKDIARILIQQQITGPLAAFLGNALFGGGGGGAGFLTTPVATIAKGGVFQSGSLTAFASGGVVNSPTLFPMARGGTGLMGEAGPEAVLPLTRVGGDLGVRADIGGGMGGSGNITVTVINETGQAADAEVETGESSNGDRSVIVRLIAEDIAKNDIARRGPLSKSLEREFGLNRSGTR